MGLGQDDVSLTALWNLGLGTVTVNSLVTAHSPVTAGANGLMTSVLLANLPQLIVTLLYFFYNSLFTSMLLATEWAEFARKRQPLRVSLPERGQRATYWLQLPYQYAVPMVAASTTLHWLISQSIFLACVTFYYQDMVDEGASFTRCGYSCIAIIFAIILASVMVLVCIMNGFRRYHSGLPLAGSCSLAISAACHRPADDPDAAKLPLMWGEVETDDTEVGHCCFSSKEVKTPVVHRLYA